MEGEEREQCGRPSAARVKKRTRCVCVCVCVLLSGAWVYTIHTRSGVQRAVVLSLVMRLFSPVVGLFLQEAAVALREPTKAHSKGWSGVLEVEYCPSPQHPNTRDPHRHLSRGRGAAPDPSATEFFRIAFLACLMPQLLIPTRKMVPQTNIAQLYIYARLHPLAFNNCTSSRPAGSDLPVSEPGGGG
jgi:hypothetical protein